MSRDEGFPHADVATAKHSDPKFRALWRSLRDEAAMNAAVVLYEAVQLASWQHGERLTAEDAAPVWFTDLDAPTEALRDVGLLDTEGRIPRHAWDRWFGAARERRQNLRDKWARADKRRRDKASPTVEPPRSPRGGNGGPAAPVSQSDSQSINQARKPSRALTRGKNDGSKDPEERRRELLAELETPDLPAWKREAITNQLSVMDRTH